MAPSSPPLGRAGLSPSIPVSLPFSPFISPRVWPFFSILSRSHSPPLSGVYGRRSRFPCAVGPYRTLLFISSYTYLCIESSRQTATITSFSWFFMGLLKKFSISVYYSSSLLFNSMSNVSGHGQMAIVSSCRFVRVVAAAAMETGSNRIGRYTQPIPLPLLPAYHLLLWNVLIVKSLYCLSLFLSLSPFH
jgi:hypothetical protein